MSLKAFDLIQVTERSSNEKGVITCIELTFENLYIGTSDAFLIHYSIEKGTSPAGKVTYMNKLQRQKHLGLKKPIKDLIACTHQLLVLCDSNVYWVSNIGLNYRSNASREIFTGISAMAVNKKPPDFKLGETQVCLATKRKTVRIVSISSENVAVLKEITLSEIPSVLSVDLYTICTVLGRQYCLINYQTLAVQNLFEHESQVLPLVKRIGPEEFLLNGPTHTMGMIVNSHGLSMHQPMTWSDGVSSVACSYPYILVLGESTVTVHSLLDQKQKIVLGFTNGVVIDNFDGQVFIATTKSVMVFVPVPFDKQIEFLLNAKRITEVFEILLVACKTDQNKYSAAFEKKVQAQAAFVYFKEADYENALHWFLESLVDPCEVITFYPGLLPSNSSFKQNNTLHSIKGNVNSILPDQSLNSINKAKQFLIVYLESIKTKSIETNTALAKLYIEFKSEKIETFVTNEELCYDDMVLSLEEHKQYHFLALYCVKSNFIKKAIDIWHKLCHQKLVDATFPGVPYVVGYLCTVNNLELLWNNIPWMFKIDQIVAVEIFTSHDTFNQDRVFEFLQKYPFALQIYLEHLIFDRKIEKKAFHTHLAVMYATHAITLLNSENTIAESIEAARKRLQTHLENSSQYCVSTLLKKISDYPLYQEKAILCGKLGQHERALKILVYEEKDPDAAVRYCDMLGNGKDRAQRQHIFLGLLKVYLKSDDESIRTEHFVMQAVRLLNTRHADFDAAHVLGMLPEDWSIALIEPFISGALRQNTHERRTRHVEKSLTRGNYVKTWAENISLHTGYLKLSDTTECDACNRPYTQSVCVRYPNNKCVHPQCCTDKHVCPVTKQRFK